MCSQACKARYEYLRSKLYSRMVVPARTKVDRLERQVRIAKEENLNVVSIHNAFCDSDNPLEFLKENLDDDLYQVVVNEIGDDEDAGIENTD